MENLIQQIFTILTTPPGNLIYHLALVFAIMASLQAVMAARRASQFIYSSRVIIGLLILLAGQLALFILSGMAWQGMANPHTVLPPLDRAITAISLVWIIWLWSFPTPSRFADVATGLLNFAVLVLYLFTMTAWGNQIDISSFNASGLEWGWQIFSIFISLAGILLLTLQRPEGWGFGFVMLLFSMTGAILHLLIHPAVGDFAAVVRLLQLCAFPLLPSLAQRVHPIAIAESVSVERDETSTGQKQFAAEARVFYSWLELALKDAPNDVRQGLAKAVGQTMLADLCYIISASDDDDLSIHCGYDLLREEYLPGTRLEREKVPALTGALQRGKPLRLGEEKQKTPDFAALAEAIQLEKPGSLLFIPLVKRDQIWGGILLLSPYSYRIWTSEDQSYLMTASESMVKLLERSETPMDSITMAGQENGEELKRKYESLVKELEGLRSHQATSSQVEGLLTVQEDLRAIIDNLQAENDQLQATLKSEKTPAQPDTIHFESELHLALEEVAHLQNALAGANMKILSLEMQARNSLPESMEQKEVTASIVQEIRQPMASIVGYTDLLMSESVGILGELQRKFLERIKSSIERMNTLLDDLIRITNVEYDPTQRQPQSVDVTDIIDDAVADTAAQLREKNITLRMDIPESLPLVHADRDALQQVIIHLLQNAGAASPSEGTVDLRLAIQEGENDNPYLLLQVTDTGGGIAEEDLMRVFSRQYRAENPLIQGLGDTGVGLSIARSLTEAQGGRIWAESISGQSTTFSVLLPTLTGYPEEIEPSGEEE